MTEKLLTGTLSLNTTNQQSVDRRSTNLLSKREYRQFGNVVPNRFHFYTRLITKLHGKTKCYENRKTYLFVYLFLIPLVIAGCTRKDFLLVAPYDIIRCDVTDDVCPVSDSVVVFCFVWDESSLF